jgi:hypothetical protein
LDNLYKDDELLNICELVKEQNLQMFLISFVELNIDIESIEIVSWRLFRDYRMNHIENLADHINVFVAKMKGFGYELNLPVYTTETLPPINL